MTLSISRSQQCKYSIFMHQYAAIFGAHFKSHWLKKYWKICCWDAPIFSVSPIVKMHQYWSTVLTLLSLLWPSTLCMFQYLYVVKLELFWAHFNSHWLLKYWKICCWNAPIFSVSPIVKMHQYFQYLPLLNWSYFELWNALLWPYSRCCDPALYACFSIS